MHCSWLVHFNRINQFKIIQLIHKFINNCVIHYLIDNSLIRFNEFTDCEIFTNNSNWLVEKILFLQFIWIISYDISFYITDSIYLLELYLCILMYLNQLLINYQSIDLIRYSIPLIKISKNFQFKFAVWNCNISFAKLF